MEENKNYVYLPLDMYNELYKKSLEYDRITKNKEFITKDNIRLVIRNKEEVLDNSNDGDLRKELISDIKALEELLKTEFIDTSEV